MENYYELFDLSPDTLTDDLKKQIYQQMRIWSHRTNAPHIERRQEAERMVRILEEMEEILLDDEKRKEYDQQLQTFLGEHEKEKETTSSDEPIFPIFEPVQLDKDDLEKSDDETATTVVVERFSEEELHEKLEEGKNLLQADELDQALEIALQLSKETDTNPRIWSLLGNIHLKMLDFHASMTAMIKARDLEPQNSEYVAQLGQIYLELGNQTRARDQFKRAINLDPKNISYKFQLGSLHVKQNLFSEGMRLIEQCVKAEPNNVEYLHMLAKAYLGSACDNWAKVSSGNPFLPPGRYPTEKADIKRAEVFLQKASQIPIHDVEIKNEQHRLRSQIQMYKKRKFAGSWFMVVLSFVSLYLTNRINPSDLNLIFIGLPILYILSAFAPSFRIFRRETQAKSGKTDFAYIYAKLKKRFGTIGTWLVSLILLAIYCLATAFFLIFVIIRNLYKNYLSTS